MSQPNSASRQTSPSGTGQAATGEKQPIARMVQQVQQHEVTPLQLVEQSLARAGKYQDQFRAFIKLTPDLARKQAGEVSRQLAQGRNLPLAGVPFAVKDLYDVAGTDTTAGSRALIGNRATEDCTAVRKLVRAGAICMGKLNMHECAYGFTGENEAFGNCRNPWNPERIAGGSSSGSAVAVALDICPLTLGSDTGGSIRQPSALCGLTGLKPTYGRVSRSGVIPLSWTMDHVGPMVRSAVDAARVLHVLAGHDPRDEATTRRAVPDYLAQMDAPVRGRRIGIPRKWFFDSLTKDVGNSVEQAIESFREAGCTVEDVELPLMEEVLGAHRAIIFPEASSYYQPLVGKKADSISPGILSLLQAGSFFPATDYLKALRVRRLVRKQWAEVFRKVDCLITPTTPMTATAFGQETAALPGGDKPLVRAYLDLTLPFNLSGHPAISVPCGISADNLPIGLQIVGRPFEEGTILHLAGHWQQQTDWHQRRPPAAG